MLLSRFNVLSDPKSLSARAWMSPACMNTDSGKAVNPTSSTHVVFTGESGCSHPPR
jgi:hypothetical protein